MDETDKGFYQNCQYSSEEWQTTTKSLWFWIKRAFLGPGANRIFVRFDFSWSFVTIRPQ